MQQEGVRLPCGSCGAPLPVAGAAIARCLFCLRRTAVPARLRRPITELEHARQQVEEAADSARRVRPPGVLFILLLALIAALGMLPIVSTITGFTTARDLMTLVISAPFFGAPIALLAYAFGPRATHLARLVHLPYVIGRFRAGSRPLALGCPSCGATLGPAGDALTTTCPHCRTEAMLPAHLVDRRLRREHNAAMRVRQYGTHLYVMATVDANVLYRLVLALSFLFSGVFGTLATVVFWGQGVEGMTPKIALICLFCTVQYIIMGAVFLFLVRSAAKKKWAANPVQRRPRRRRRRRSTRPDQPRP